MSVNEKKEGKVRDSFWQIVGSPDLKEGQPWLRNRQGCSGGTKCPIIKGTQTGGMSKSLARTLETALGAGWWWQLHAMVLLKMSPLRFYYMQLKDI